MWQWWCPKDESGEGALWWEVAASVSFFKPPRPSWLDRPEMAAVMGYCDKHSKLFYHGSSFGGCYDCYRAEKYPSKPEEKIAWNGW
jgi:hypothetical protein